MSTRRPDNAVEVWFEEKRIGWLKNTTAKDLNLGPLTLVMSSPDPSAVKEVRMQVREREFSVSRHKFMTLGMEEASRSVREHVPAYAESEQDILRDMVRFYWRVLEIELLGVCELLFDYEHFEPDAVGGPDPEPRTTVEMFYEDPKTKKPVTLVSPTPVDFGTILTKSLAHGETFTFTGTLTMTED